MSMSFSPQQRANAPVTWLLMAAGSRPSVEFAALQAGLEHAALDRARCAHGAAEKRVGECGGNAECCSTAEKIAAVELAGGNAPAQKFEFSRQ